MSKIFSVNTTVFIIGLICIGCTDSPENESFQLEFEADSTVASIGDVITVKVGLKGGGSRVTRFPEWEVKEPMEIRSRRDLIQSPDGRKIEFEIVFWDTGQFFIPSYQLEILKQDSTLEYVMETDSVPIFIRSIIAQDSIYQVAGTVELKPIKGPPQIFFPWPIKKISYIILLIGLAGAILFIWSKRVPPKYRFSRSVRESPAPDKNALDRIVALSKKLSDSNGSGKYFYSELSHILREYIEFSFYIKTLEMTTEDIYRILGRLPFAGPLGDIWIDILERADLVKYARQDVDQMRIQKDLESARKFVQETTSFWKLNGPSNL